MHRQRKPKRRKSQPTLARTIRTSPAKSQPGARRAARLALISTVPWCRLPRSARDRNAVAVFRRRRFNYKAGLSEIALLTFGVLPNGKKRRFASNRRLLSYGPSTETNTKGY